MNKITEDILKKKSHQFDVETIYVLSLSNQGIFDLGSLGLCKNLVQLDLSKNSLSSVMVLRTLTLLQYLNLSENRLSALSGVEQLESLEYLNVSGNFLNSVDSLLPLTKIRTIKTLFMKEPNSHLSNPVIDSFGDNPEDLTQKIKYLLPSLTCLDGLVLSDEGAEFNELCSNFNNTSFQKDLKKFLGSLSTPKSYNIIDTPFVRIGFEENETYTKAKELNEDCESLANDASQLLTRMRQNYM